MKDDDKTLKAVWCVDSKTGEQVLIDTVNNIIVARRDKEGNIHE
jgi:hypothetical protein